MKLKIVVDPTMCIGAASCVTVSPSYFQMNNENKAVVLDNGTDSGADDRTYERIVEVDEAHKDEIILAAQSCPTAAVSVFDADTGEKLFPKDFHS